MTEICFLTTFPRLLLAVTIQLPASDILAAVIMIELSSNWTILSSYSTSFVLCCQNMLGYGLPLKYFNHHLIGNRFMSDLTFILSRASLPSSRLRIFLMTCSSGGKASGQVV